MQEAVLVGGVLLQIVLRHEMQFGSPDEVTHP